jgi:YihY family inner membrane protein
MPRIRIPNVVGFLVRVLRDFFLRNHGMLLTGSVAFNLMLSLIPLCAVLVVFFSSFIHHEIMMETLVKELEMISPGFAPTIVEVIEGFLRNRNLIGGIGFLSLLLFSSKAFRVIEDSFAVIFHKPLPGLKRRFWISALLPYLFILIIAAGLILITAANALLDAGGDWLAGRWPALDRLVGGHAGKWVYLTSFCGLVMLFASLYKIIPVVTVSFTRALAGGLTAALLWELLRHFLVAYYSNIPTVNVIYGSMATIVIILLTLEAAAFILLLGAQVIAHLQRNANLGIPWHQEIHEQPPGAVGQAED